MAKATVISLFLTKWCPIPNVRDSVTVYYRSTLVFMHTTVLKLQSSSLSVSKFNRQMCAYLTSVSHLAVFNFSLLFIFPTYYLLLVPQVSVCSRVLSLVHVLSPSFWRSSMTIRTSLSTYINTSIFCVLSSHNSPMFPWSTCLKSLQRTQTVQKAHSVVNSF